MHQGMNHVVINGGLLLFFDARVKADDKDDILDSTLYAQLAASKKRAKFDEYRQWKDTWLAAAIRFGWMTRRHEVYVQPVKDLTPGTLWDWIGQLCPVFASPALIQSCEAAVRASHDCEPLQPGFKMLAANVLGKADTSLALQLGMVSATSELLLIQLHARTLRPLNERFLFEPLTALDINGNIELSFHKMGLDQLQYTQHRSNLAEALQARKAALVSELQSATACLGEAP